MAPKRTSGDASAAAATASCTCARSRCVACTATAVSNAVLVAKWRKGAPGDTPARLAASRTLSLSSPSRSISSTAASISASRRLPW
ncbi:hypothetical protein ASC92_09055 [Variovorax sp. Root411]|nr:hypothetical protein ASC92_09055 [Variovorax sp. Root411]